MWFGHSEIKRLRTEIKNLDIALNDMHTNQALKTARTELAEIRSGRTVYQPQASESELLVRRREFQRDLRTAKEALALKFSWVGSVLWTILGIYALVWLSNTPHPEWAMATTLALGAAMGFIALVATATTYMIWSS
jgi:hypothetical protein